jgi:ParB-like chromosome segregation protein Spo0J
LKQPINAVEWVTRDALTANGYNPNHVARPELKLLKLSIMADGWTQPIVARADGEIVDGFHRWTIAADPEISTLTGGLVPVVRLRSALDMADQIASTIRHNRARGQHTVLPMADIVTSLKDEHGLSDAQVKQKLGMDNEEVERLYDTSGMPTRGSDDAFHKGWTTGERGIYEVNQPE